MSWTGKILGAGIGLAFGPLGALAGAACGHFFMDRRRDRSDLKMRQEVLLLLSSSLYELALRDGPFKPAEERVLLAILGDGNARLDARFSLRDLPVVLEQSRAIPQPLGRLVMQVRTEPDLARWTYISLLRLALSDGPLDEREVRYLDGLPGQLGIPPDLAAYLGRIYIFSRPGSEGLQRAEACRILGVSPAASREEVKKAYRTLCMTYHPDRHAGLPPEIRELASEKFNQITRAYDTLSGGGPLPELWARSPEGGTLIRALPGSVVKCIGCGTRVRLPDPFDPATARCPECQALLAFEKEFLEIL